LAMSRMAVPQLGVAKDERITGPILLTVILARTLSAMQVNCPSPPSLFPKSQRPIALWNLNRVTIYIPFQSSRSLVPEKGAESLEWVKPGGPSDPGEVHE